MQEPKYRAGAQSVAVFAAFRAFAEFGLPFFCGHTFFLFSGVAELEQEARCIIHRSVCVRSEWLCLRMIFLALFVVGGMKYVRWYVTVTYL